MPPTNNSRHTKEGGMLLVLVLLLGLFYHLTPRAVGLVLPSPLFISNRALLATSAFAYDARENRVLFEKEADTILPLASLTKVMTAIVVAETLPEDAMIPITHEAILAEGADGLREGSLWKRDDLIRFMLVESSNDGAHAFAETYKEATGMPITDAMNQKAQDLGLPTLSFVNESGLDTANDTGGKGSAHDVAGLLLYAWKEHPDLFSATAQKEALFSDGGEKLVTAENTNKDILSFPGRVVSKTGLTKIAGGNLAVVVEKGPLHDIVIVVLGSTEKGRFTDVATIAEKVFRSS